MAININKTMRNKKATRVCVFAALSNKWITHQRDHMHIKAFMRHTVWGTVPINITRVENISLSEWLNKTSHTVKIERWSQTHTLNRFYISLSPILNHTDFRLWETPIAVRWCSCGDRAMDQQPCWLVGQSGLTGAPGDCKTGWRKL